MFVEKKRLAVPPRLLIADGNENGLISVADSRGFYVGQIVQILSDAQQPRQFKIKRFMSPTEFKVGPTDSGVGRFSDTSDFLVADNARILAGEQDRATITEDDRDRAVYAEEPIVAYRTIGVDQFGNYYDEDNPMPVQLSGDIQAELDVNITHLDQPGRPHDSVRIGDGVIEARITPSLDSQRRGLEVVELAKAFTQPWDGVRVELKNDDGDPLQIISSYGGVDVQVLNLIFDEDGDFENIQVVTL